MRFLAAFDKFKDALGAGEVCGLARQTLEACLPGSVVTEAPLSDGGEGFCEILTKAAGGRFSSYVVSGPLGDPVEARIGYVLAANLSSKVRELADISAEGEVAVVEMASAAGLEQIPFELRNPWPASTLGVGELLRHATEEGAASILLGIGGSATNDLGLGALRSLGLHFLDAQGGEIENPCPATWPRLSAITGELLVMPPLRIACDVDNPLLGPCGAAATYGPQKGLVTEDVERMDAEAGLVARLLLEKFGVEEDALCESGSGAAGGIGFGLGVARGCRFIRGFPLVAAWVRLREKIAEAEVVLTGEGRFDSTSLVGKGPGRVLGEAVREGRAAFVLAGLAEEEAVRAAEERFPGVRVLSLSRPELSLEKNLGRTREFFEQTLRKLVEEEEWTMQ